MIHTHQPDSSMNSQILKVITLVLVNLLVSFLCGDFRSESSALCSKALHNHHKAAMNHNNVLCIVTQAPKCRQ